MNAKNIPFGMPLIDENERDAVANVLNGPILVHGPQAVAFEAASAEFSGAPHAVSVSSCTAGMHLVWFNQNIGAGDEVIVPAQTHVATAHAVELTGACPIFVDCELDTGNIDIDAIEAAITPRTKGIVVVHFLGMPVDMTRVMEIADRHDLFVLEDCALSVGAKLDGIHTGLLGHAGVFSFYPVKHMTTAEGGIIITKDRELADRLRLTKAFGVDRTHGERKIPGLYDVTELGFNYRMSEIHAAIGIEQIAKLPKFIEDRVRNDDLLREALTKIDGISVLNTTSRGRFTATHYCLSII
ncbi:MAG: DegT/DnrJ/EryC1/StrS family aminotransferase, partial [Phycisphaeraceae bacterium]|nr:DegT/DnrJ/EryC1/StrS family aminotransferase [Phycisphaeraceae bacterium]